MTLPQRRGRGFCSFLCYSLIGAGLSLVLPLRGFPNSWDRAGAQHALEEARRLESELHARSSGSGAARSEQKYLECIRLFQEVYFKDPHFVGSDDAVFAAASLYLEAGERFRRPDYVSRASKLFRFLVSDYPSSRFVAEARSRAEVLASKTGATGKVSAPQPASLKTPAKLPSGDLAKLEAPGPEAPRADSHVIIHGVRYFSTAGYTRVIFDFDSKPQYSRECVPDPDRIFFDIRGGSPGPDLRTKNLTIEDGVLKQVRFGLNRPEVTRIVLDLDGSHEYSVFNLEDPARIMIDIRAAQVKGAHSQEVKRALPGTLEPAGPARAKAKGGGPVESAAALPLGPLVPPAVRSEAPAQNAATTQT